MKIAEITPGHRYRIHLSEEQSFIYRGCDIIATVLRVGVFYDVVSSRGSMVRGAPYTSAHRSERASGVEVQWEAQEVVSSKRHAQSETVTADRTVINARAILHPLVD
jgi:hypothetical protein